VIAENSGGLGTLHISLFDMAPEMAQRLAVVMLNGEAVTNSRRWSLEPLAEEV
jgi:hypothetical protein